MSLSTGSTFPTAEFGYVPVDLAFVEEAPALACGKPQQLNTDKLLQESKGSNVLFIGAVGAFTPPCTEDHIPGYLDHLRELKEKKNISAVVFITVNDPFVNNAWAKLLLHERDLPTPDVLPHLIFASDVKLEFAKKHDLFLDLSGGGLGERTKRFALVVSADDKKIKYAGIEKGPDVDVSSYESVIKHI